MPIKRDGPVTTGTRENLILGLRSKPMQESAVDRALGQAMGFAERLVNTYSTEIAAGEVGIDGSGQASEEDILGARAPTVLLYGRVQSGKTAAMILTSAICLDNGFRIILVLTANNVALVQQTANRFKALNGPRVFSSVKLDMYEWEGQEDQLREDIATDGLVLVCAKDSFHLPQIIQFLQSIEAPSYPALILDDEADAATPDTTLAARSSGRANAPQYPSTINRRVIENPVPGEQGESIGELFPHGLYVQVTATPYVLFLQKTASRIRPNVTLLLEPGEGYCGGEAFFGAFDINSNTPPAPPLVLVADQEGQAINRRRVPTGLISSVEFFCLAAAARATILRGQWPIEGFKHLAHTSHRINQHALVIGMIEKHVNQLRRQMRDDLPAAAQIFAGAYDELRRTVGDAPPIEQLLPVIADALRQAEFIRVNSETDVPRYGPRLNFLVGGNILGRGLTIDDLLVTYYVREAQVSQMDTVWQHARMYGYRQPLMPYTRVYLPRGVAARFKGVHETEEELRAIVRRWSEGEDVPIRVAINTRPTRPNALEPSALRVYRADLDQVFPRFVVENPSIATDIRTMLIELGVPLAADERDARTTQVPLESLIEIVNMIPVQDGDPGRWDAGAVTALIETFRDRYGERGPIYARRLTTAPGPGGWLRGRLSGPEIDLIRAAANGVPALAMMYLGDEPAPRAWYPTLVLPPRAATYIVNPL